jgi:hypothetical protein
VRGEEGEPRGQWSRERQDIDKGVWQFLNSPADLSVSRWLQGRCRHGELGHSLSPLQSVRACPTGYSRPQQPEATDRLAVQTNVSSVDFHIRVSLLFHFATIHLCSLQKGSEIRYDHNSVMTTSSLQLVICVHTALEKWKEQPSFKL